MPQEPTLTDYAITALFVQRPSIAYMCRGDRSRLAIKNDCTIKTAELAAQMAQQNLTLDQLDAICKEQHDLDRRRVQAWCERQAAEQRAIEADIMQELGL